MPFLSRDSSHRPREVGRLLQLCGCTTMNSLGTGQTSEDIGMLDIADPKLMKTLQKVRPRGGPRYGCKHSKQQIHRTPDGASDFTVL